MIHGNLYTLNYQFNQEALQAEDKIQTKPNYRF